MDHIQKILSFLVLGLFCASVIFAPWELKISVGDVTANLGTEYSPIWKPPSEKTTSAERRPLTAQEIEDLKSKGYDVSKYDGRSVDIPASSVTPTNVKLRTEIVLLEWAGMAVFYVGLISILKSSKPKGIKEV